VGDYSKTTWVENVTKVGPTNLNKIEQEIADATKQASMDAGTTFDGTNATTNDTKRTVWRRQSDGSYLASNEAYETGAAGAMMTVLIDRVQRTGMVSGDQVRRLIEARGTGGAFPGRAAVVANYMRNDFSSIWVEVKKESGSADPTLSPILLRDDGYSDWYRAVNGLYSTRPAAGVGNKNQFYWASDTGQLFFNPTGSAWLLIYGPMEASAITTPSSGFGTHYVNYTSSFRYWKDPMGYVHAVGEINDDGTALAATAANSIIWDGFPAGYRPIGRSYFELETNVAGATNHILINTSGQIRVSDNYGANPGRYMNFGHITFPTF
jgi:hypothetical protein